MPALYNLNKVFWHPIAKLTTRITALPVGEDDKYTLNLIFYGADASVLATEAEITKLLVGSNLVNKPYSEWSDPE
jgi:hypothetical protein